MGVLRKLQTTDKGCDKKPMLPVVYQGGIVYAETEGGTPDEVLLDSTGAPLSAGANLAFQGTISNQGCADIQLDILVHYADSGACDECVPNVLATETITVFLPKNYEFDLPGAFYSSLLVTTGEMAVDGTFTPGPIPVGAPAQEIRFTSCYTPDCCGAVVFPA